MNETLTAYSIILLPAKKLWLFVLPPVVLGTLLVCFIFSSSSFHEALQSNQGTVVFVVVLLMLYLQPSIELLWLISGKVTITLNEDLMEVERCFLGVRTVSLYKMANMSNISITVNEATNTFLSIGRGRLLGFTYKNPVRFSFEYEGSTKKLGNYCENFPAVELREQIYERTGRFG